MIYAIALQQHHPVIYIHTYNILNIRYGNRIERCYVIIKYRTTMALFDDLHQRQIIIEIESLQNDRRGLFLVIVVVGTGQLLKNVRLVIFLLVALPLYR